MFGKIYIFISVFSAVVAIGSTVLVVEGHSHDECRDDVSNEPIPQPLAADSVRAMLPVGTRIDFCDMALRGWKLGGELYLDMPSAMHEILGIMRTCGYSCRHSVGQIKGERMLTEWQNKAGMKVIWSLSRADWNRTRFSWGASE